MKLRQLSAALMLAGLFPASAVQAANLFVLPTPENNGYASYGSYMDASGATRDAIIMNGVPIAFKYDGFWSYSAHVLDAIQTARPTWLPAATFGTYDFSVGTGGIAVNITSNAVTSIACGYR